jgi:hypothetical protein
MRHIILRYRRILVALGALSAGLIAWPTVATAQAVSGNATAVRATTIGLFGSTTTELAGTGTLGGSTDAREASQTTGQVPSLLTGETLHATTIGWPDQAASEASLARLALTVAGTSIGADSVLARAMAASDGAGYAISNIDSLTINGVPMAVSGEPNQTLSIPGGLLVINEQQTSGSLSAVNALHVILDGVADVVIGSATASIQ